ncbi:hypothetical protein JNO12_24195 [Erwinia aphidicola]|nr:hypothetical protein [Erwinia aphidicola]
MVLSEKEWSGRNRIRLNPAVSGIYINRAALESGFEDERKQRYPIPARLSGNLDGLDVLLKRSGWCRESVDGDDPLLHHLLAC